MKLQTILKTIFAAALVAELTIAAAQPAPYPTKPIKVLVGVPPGGSTDALTRMLADWLQESLGHVQCLERGSLMRRTRLSDGHVSINSADAPEELRLNEGILANVFGPEYRMLLIGAGQLTEYLATMALFSGFAVAVCGPREEYRGTEAGTRLRTAGGRRFASRMRRTIGRSVSGSGWQWP